MPHLDASALERDVDGVALLAAALGIPGFQPVRVGASSAARNPGRHLPCQSGQLPCVV